MAPAVARILRRCVANTLQVSVQLTSSLQTSRGSLKPVGGSLGLSVQLSRSEARLLDAIHHCDHLNSI